jgi:hypothetical protein
MMSWMNVWMNLWVNVSFCMMNVLCVDDVGAESSPDTN